MYISDVHTHTIASGHGNSCTISDMAKAAAAKGIRLLGISDHGPATLAATHPSYFRGLLYSPKKRFNIDLLYGIELNILDTNGRMDLEDSILSDLDYAIASMHTQTFRPSSTEDHTRAYINAIRHPMVKIIGHADDPHFPADYDEIARAASNYGTIFEINEASVRPGSYRGDTHANTLRLLDVSLKYNIPLILSSDSHGTEHIGDFAYSERLLHENIFPESRILNNNIPYLKMFLTDHR